MRADDLQGGADDFRRRRDGTGDHAVGNIEGDEAGSKENIVFRQDLMGLFDGHALLGPPFCKIFTELVHHRIRFGVDDFNTVHIDLVFRSDFDDTLGTSDEDGTGKAFGLDPFGSLQDAAAFRFRQDDLLLFFRNSAFQVIDKA